MNGTRSRYKLAAATVPSPLPSQSAMNSAIAVAWVLLALCFTIAAATIQQFLIPGMLMMAAIVLLAGCMVVLTRTQRLTHQ